MVYYNTVAKVYKSKSIPSLRFVRFDSLRKKATTDKERTELHITKIRSAVLKAELAEAVGSSQPRDFKAESIARAKRLIKEIIRNNYSNRLKLLTLTYGLKVTDRDQVLEDIKSMTKRYQLKYGHALKYIASLEWQEPRHCLHVHMVIDSIFLPTQVWSGSLWRKGFVKINTIASKKCISDCISAVDYVLKYIEKDAYSGGDYKHVYFRSRNWNMDYKSEHIVTADFEDCISVAKRYLAITDVFVERFDCQIWDGSWLEVVDVYAGTEYNRVWRDYVDPLEAP